MPSTTQSDMEVSGLTERFRNPLTLSDRCDECGAQAFVRVFLPSGDLLFCGHHFAEKEPTFVARGYEIQDERDRINKPEGDTR